MTENTNLLQIESIRITRDESMDTLSEMGRLLSRKNQKALCEKKGVTRRHITPFIVALNGANTEFGKICTLKTR